MAKRSSSRPRGALPGPQFGVNLTIYLVSYTRAGAICEVAVGPNEVPHYECWPCTVKFPYSHTLVTSSFYQRSSESE